MVKHSKGKKPKGRGGLIAMLLVLVFVIAGLTIAIIVIHNNTGGSDENINVGGESVSSAQNELQEIMLSNDDVYIKINRLNDMLNSGRAEDGTGLSEQDVFSIKLAIAHLYLLTQYNNDMTFKILGELELAEKSDDNLKQLYEAYIYAYNAIGDAEKMEEYMEKYNEMGGQ
jgi:hypothetical protein